MPSAWFWKSKFILALAMSGPIAVAAASLNMIGDRRATSTVQTALGGVCTIAFYFVCDLAAKRIGLPLPSSVIGLAAMAAVIVACRPAYEIIGRVFDGVVAYMPLLFVPAGIGVLAASDVFSASWIPLALAVTLGTAATLMITGAMAQLLFKTPNRSTEKTGLEAHNAA